MASVTGPETKLRWGKFWWDDWLNDIDLRPCSGAARALWIDMLCLMARGEPFGHLTFHGVPMPIKRLAAIYRGTEREVGRLLQELREAHVFSETTQGVIFSRRMVRDRAASDAGRQNGKGGGNPKLKQRVNPDDEGEGLTPPDKLEAEAEAEAEKEAEQPPPLVPPPGPPPPAAPAAKQVRGTRLPEGWRPSPDDERFAQERGLDVEETLANFRDYWRDVPGQRGTKISWSGTWRNRCRDLAGSPRLQSRTAPAGRRADEAEANERRLRELDQQRRQREGDDDLFTGPTIEAEDPLWQH